LVVFLVFIWLEFSGGDHSSVNATVTELLLLLTD